MREEPSRVRPLELPPPAKTCTLCSLEVPADPVAAGWAHAHDNGNTLVARDWHAWTCPGCCSKYGRPRNRRERRARAAVDRRR